jgi:hypothetical protein
VTALDYNQQTAHLAAPDFGLYYNRNVGQLSFVYLTSTPFSGSTLFSFLAAAHPGLATVGEMTGLVNSTDPDLYECSCGRRIRQCPFWAAVARNMSAKGHSFDPGRFDTRLVLGRRRWTRRFLSGTLGNTKLEDIRDLMLTALPTQRTRLRFLIARNKALAYSILEACNKSVFLDASKSADAIRHFNREADLDLRVVHLVRDVRGFSCSRRKNKGESDLRKIAGLWARAHSNIERQLERLPPERWLRIRYEDVCNSTLDTLNRFFQFCALHPLRADDILAPREHHIVGNRMRLSNFSVIRPDESWRRQLTIREQDEIASVASRLHLRYGYEPMAHSDLTAEAA